MPRRHDIENHYETCSAIVYDNDTLVLNYSADATSSGNIATLKSEMDADIADLNTRYKPPIGCRHGDVIDEPSGKKTLQFTFFSAEVAGQERRLNSAQLRTLANGLSANGYIKNDTPQTGRGYTKNVTAEYIHNVADRTTARTPASVLNPAASTSGTHSPAAPAPVTVSGGPVTFYDTCVAQLTQYATTLFLTYKLPPSAFTQQTATHQMLIKSIQNVMQNVNATSRRLGYAGTMKAVVHLPKNTSGTTNAALADIEVEFNLLNPTGSPVVVLYGSMLKLLERELDREGLLKARDVTIITQSTNWQNTVGANASSGAQGSNSSIGSTSVQGSNGTQGPGRSQGSGNARGSGSARD